MKECIDRILKGQFEYERGELSFSVRHIELTMHAGENAEGSFTIAGPKDRHTEGTVTSTEIRMEVLTDHFSGEKDEIAYRFHSEGLTGGDVVRGEFRIISNHGEYMLPFTFTAMESKASSSLGDIRNLFHFANLAKANWDEALHLFYSSSFHYILSGNDQRFQSLYRGLCKVPMSQRNMEEFLLAVSKKHPITFVPDVDHFDIEAYSYDVTNDFSLALTKSGWGYSYLEVTGQGDFISFDKKVLTEDDFLGSTCYFHFQVDNSRLHSGVNLGRIVFSNLNTNLVINVTVKTLPEAGPDFDSYIRKKKLTLDIMNLYVDFRGRKVSSTQWLSDTGKLISRMLAQDKSDTEFQLYAAQYLITAGRINQGQYTLEQLRPTMQDMVGRPGRYSQELYCYYLYLQTLVSRKEPDIQKAAGIIEDVYKRNPDSWRIAWILGYVSDEYSMSATRKWTLMEDQYDRGCRSPIIYLEALSILRKKVTLITHMGDFALAVLTFAADQGILTIPLMEQITYLSRNVRTYDKRLYRILKACYDSQDLDDTLEAICALLMKGERTDEESFAWYRKGVARQLRLTRLYEYYMMSMPETPDGSAAAEIPKVVLMYFAYQSALSWEKNAILYRYILESREEYPELFDSYRLQIEQYLLHEIDKKHISLALGWLYEHLVTRQMIDVTNAPKFLSLMYTNRIIPEAPGMSEVIVIYDKCRRQMHYPITGGYADVPLYGSEYTILLADSADNRFAVSATYKKIRMMNPGNLPALTLPFIQKGRENLDIFLCELGRSAYTITMDNVERYRDLADSDLIREDVRAQIRSDLIRFYYDNDFMRQLSEYLGRLEPERLTPRQRGEMLELMVLTGMYEKALTWLRRYGCYQVDAKIVMRLCGRYFDPDSDAGDKVMAEIAWYAFHMGKYDEPTLVYLCRAFTGTAREMRDLFRAAESFDMENRNLMERILVQMMYTGSYVGDHQTLFQKYVKAGSSPEVEMAYIALRSYEYFARDEVTEAYLYTRVAGLWQLGNKIPDITKMAYLRYYAEEAGTGNGRRDMINAFLRDLVSKNLYFSFYKQYIGADPVMNRFADRTILEYRTRARAICKIHYIIISDLDADPSAGHGAPEDDEYEECEMKQMCDGVYAASFILFYGEHLQYYITEETPCDGEDGRKSMQMLTGSGTLSGTETTAGGAGEGMFGIINDMMMAETVQDEKAQERLAGEYYKNHFLTEELFRPI